MKSMDQKERRRSIRHPLKLSYNFVLGGDTYIGLTGNVSLTGVFLQSISPKISINQVEQEINLNMKLAGKEFLSRAIIVYIGDSSIPLMSGVGIEFIKPHEDMIRRLKRYILKQANN